MTTNIYVTEPIPSGRVKLQTSNGPIEISLWAKETPLACRNFIQLCLEGYYDGLIFHRILPGFIIQTGDPTGSGEGGDSIYDEGVFKDEINARLKFSRRGLVAMANLSQPNTNSSQFFITLGKKSSDRTDELQDKHTIFGSVVGDTIYNVLKLSETEVDRKTQRPIHPPIIKSVQVLENPFEDIVPRITSEQRKQQAKAKKEAKKERKKEIMKSKHRVLAKNKGLLSFAVEESLLKPDEGQPEHRKLKSAHDVDSNGQLSGKTPTAIEPNQSGSSANHITPASGPSQRSPIQIHSALREVLQRKETVAQNPVEDRADTIKRLKNDSKTDSSKPNQLSKIEQVKEEMRKFEADLKKSMRKDSDGSDSDDEQQKDKMNKSKEVKKKTNFLELEREKYRTKSMMMKEKKKTKGKRSRDDEDDDKDDGLVSILESFTKKLREANEIEPNQKNHDDDEKVLNDDKQQGDIIENEDNDDDQGWMTHQLKFRKDATIDLHRADEYSLIDPLSNQKQTLDELNLSKRKIKHNLFENGLSTTTTTRTVNHKNNSNWKKNKKN